MRTLGTLLLLPDQVGDPCFSLVGVAVSEPRFTLGWRLPFLQHPCPQVLTIYSLYVKLLQAYTIKRKCTGWGGGRGPPLDHSWHASSIQSRRSSPQADARAGSTCFILKNLLEKLPPKICCLYPFHVALRVYLRLLHVFSPSLSFNSGIVYDVFFHTQGFTFT